MKNLLLTFMLIALFLQACNNQETKQEEEMKNPFFSEFNTPFEFPDFTRIDTSHYLPAFKEGIERQKTEIEAIVSNTEEPTFENTILAYDHSGRLLKNVSSVFYSVNSAETNPAMQQIAREVAPLTTAHNDDIQLNEKLFARIKALHDRKDELGLDSLQMRTLEKYYKDFVRNGANLSPEDKEKLRDLNQQLSKNQLKFRDNLLAETNKNFLLVIDNEEDLAGLPDGSVSAAAEAAADAGMEGKWVFTLAKPSMIPFLQYADNRDLREKIYRGYFMRGNHNDEYDNKEAIRNIVNLRAEKAALLGYENYADYIIEKNMASTPENVYDFLDELMVPALEVAKNERAEMQSIIDAEGGDFDLQSWDWWYYAEKLRKQKYDLDEAELKPYFVLENVRDGMFHVASKLYGLEFKPLPDMPVYHPEVEVYEVTEADGSHLALLTLDYHPRPGKRVGAWCGRLRSQYYEDGEKVYPIVTITTNFTRPSGDTPALLTWDEVNTLFHEFGHALHGFFTDGEYNRIAGQVPRDMVELPSQIMENWAAHPEVIGVYARHYETGEVMPDTLLQKLMESGTFNQGFATVEYLAASYLDLDWHSLTEPRPNVDVLAFEDASMEKINLIDEIIPRYRTTYFNHIVGGYAAGYYVYIWAAVLDTDAFQAFVESGDIYNPEIAAKFRKYILTEGGNDEGMEQYLRFRGQEPSKEPLLRKRGLLGVK